MSFTTADLNAIDAAIAQSELEVQYADGKKVRYRDMDELIKARNLIQGQLAAAAANSSGGSSLFSVVDFRTCD